MIDLPPLPKLWLPTKPAIIRAASMKETEATFPFPIYANRTVPYVGWNPADKSAGYTLSNVIGANSDAGTTSGSGWQGVKCVLGRSSGKYYWEFVVVTAGTLDEWIDGANGTNPAVTSGTPTSPNAALMRSDNNVAGWTKSQAGVLAGNNAVNAVISFAVDFTAGRIWVGVGGVWAFSGDPAAGTGFWVSAVTGTVFPSAWTFNNNPRKVRLRTLASQMTGTIPSGYTAWAGG